MTINVSRWLSQVGVPASSRRREAPDLRFFLRAFREADPDFGEDSDDGPAENLMSREWLTRSMR